MNDEMLRKFLRMGGNNPPIQTGGFLISSSFIEEWCKKPFAIKTMVMTEKESLEMFLLKEKDSAHNG